MAPAPTRIVLYSDATGVGGAEISLANLAGALPDGFAVTAMGIERGVVERVAGARAGTRPVLLPLVRGPWDLARIAAHVAAIVRARPAVLHANLRVPWSCWYGVIGGLLSPGTRVVAVEQLPIRPDRRRDRWLKRRLTNRLAAHVAVGEGSARQVELYVGRPTGSVRAVYNGVPDRGPVARAPGPGPVLLGTGRFDRQKGFDLLLEALPALPEARLVLVGGGRERAALAGQAEALGVADRVELRSWSVDPRALFAQADVFVMPSRSEGFSLALVEAMQAGRPVVAARVGSIPEAVRDGETGLLVPRDDPGALARALRHLLDDPALAERLAANARALAAERFTDETMAAEFVALWRQAAGR